MSNTALTLPTSWTTTGSGTAWTNPSRITADDGSSASTSATSTQDLLGSSYGFAIPTWATIDGIEFSAKWQMPDGAAGTCTWYIYKAGSRVATTFTGWFWVWSATTVTKGSPAELWWTTWTPAQINASNFWTALAISSNGSWNQCSVDWHKVTIYFTYVGVRYWVWWTATWDSTAWTKWATTSGGTGGEAVPTEFDDVFFDSNSTGVVTIWSWTKAVKDLTLTNFAWTFYAGVSQTLTIYGSVALKTWVQNQIEPYFNFWSWVTFAGTWTHTITTNWGSFGAVNINKSTSGTYTLQDDWIETQVPWSFKSLSITAWVFDCNGYDLSFPYIAVTSAPTVDFWSGTITGYLDWIQVNSTATIDGTNATFVINCPSSAVTWFLWGGKTYKTLHITWAGTWYVLISGSNTFDNFIDDRSTAHEIHFTAWTTQTIGNFDVNWTDSTEITIRSNTTATHALVNSSGGNFECNYLNIQHSVVTPADAWLAYSSVDNQSVATAWSWWVISQTPHWTPRVEPYNEDSLFSTNITSDNPRYYPFSSDIQPWDKWYFIFSPNWNTPNWQSR